MADEPRRTAASATHVPVLRERVLALLAPALDGANAVVVDATLGLGGHAEALLDAHPRLTLVGLDRDPDALQRSERRLARFAGRTHLVHAVYDRMPDVLGELGLPDVRGVDGVLFDLGVSSLQLDVAERGFAYAQDAPLDMRMDATSGRTAADVVNGYPVRELARVLRVYGEERFALRIAQAIDRARPVTSTAQLAELVRSAIPAATRRHGGHPAKRTFQALRIEVNGELDALRAAVPAALDALRLGGRLVSLAYHSLEDRIVKQELAGGAADRTPAGLPVTLADRGPQLRLLVRGSEPATDEEVAANPRAASVRLRAAERIRVAS